MIIKTWLFNTTGPMGSPDFFGISQTGPFDIKAFLFGHGLDTFLDLFPVYKHDPNPFPQAHNCWLQLAWESGLVGFLLFTGYYLNLIRRLILAREYKMVGGLVCIGFNAVGAFPTRMTQTMGLMVAFFAYCEQKLISHK